MDNQFEPETEIDEDEFHHLAEIGLDFPFHIEREA